MSVDEEEDSENESKLSQPSASKAENEVSDKKIAFTTAVTWPWVLHGLEAKLARFHCALFAGKKLSITAMVPAKLSRHFTINHSHLSNKRSDSFQRLLDLQNKQCKVFEKKVTVSGMAQEASYLVAELIAQK
jgi:hypothetical protein